MGEIKWTTAKLLDELERRLHLNFDGESAELIELLRVRWSRLAREKTYWKRKCGKYERGLDAFLERYSDVKMPPPKKGRGTA